MRSASSSILALWFGSVASPPCSALRAPASSWCACVIACLGSLELRIAVAPRGGEEIPHVHRELGRELVFPEQPDLADLERVLWRARRRGDPGGDDDRHGMETDVAIGPRVHAHDPPELDLGDAGLLGELPHD